MELEMEDFAISDPISFVYGPNRSVTATVRTPIEEAWKG